MKMMFHTTKLRWSHTGNGFGFVDARTRSASFLAAIDAQDYGVRTAGSLIGAVPGSSVPTSRRLRT
jgi:hypothetical protein